MFLSSAAGALDVFLSTGAFTTGSEGEGADSVI